MTPKDITASRELAEKMAKAGFPQEGGIWYWCLCFKSSHTPVKHPINNKYNIEFYLLMQQEMRFFKEHTYYRAPTFSEIWKELPNIIRYKKEIYYKNLSVDCLNGFMSLVSYESSNGILLTSKEYLTPQDAAAELWLWVKEQKYAIE